MITEEMFIKAMGREPVIDELERCNCPKVGEIGHYLCGWNNEMNLPNFMLPAKTMDRGYGLKSFQQLARDLSKPGAAIAQQMTPHTAHLLHMVVGISGEAGELLDAVKKHVIYQKPLDRANMVEELGDLRFYMAGIMNALNITEDEILKQNNRKLGKRYASGSYSNQQAQNRADKENG